MAGHKADILDFHAGLWPGQAVHQCKWRGNIFLVFFIALRSTIQYIQKQVEKRGAVQSGVGHSGVVHCGVVHCGMVQSGVVQSGVVQSGVVRTM